MVIAAPLIVSIVWFAFSGVTAVSWPLLYTVITSPSLYMPAAAVLVIVI